MTGTPASGPLLLRTVYAWDQLFQRHAQPDVHPQHRLPGRVRRRGTCADTGLGDAAKLLDAAELAAGRINPLREGIAHADHVSTVSPTYAREIQTPALRLRPGRPAAQRAGALTGILNGVDYEEWDPRNRPLPAAALQCQPAGHQGTR